MSISREISQLLKDEGCQIFGFADLRILPEEPRRGLDAGIIMGAPYDGEGLKENLSGNPEKFSGDGGGIHEPLERYKAAVMAFLKESGYKASTNYRKLVITHKTVGTLAGIGWISKSALLATKEVGPALRLSVLLTNAPLECGTPITKSLCPPDCTACADICPTKAIRGGLWEQGVHRDTFFDVEACRKGRRSRKPVCGLCISACPYAKKGLGYE